SWCCGISPTPTLRLPAIGWSWSMYSKRRSKRAPGSVHTPCAFQFVLIMQNADPHEAPASAAALIASAANSNRFISSPRQNAMTRAALEAARTQILVAAFRRAAAPAGGWGETAGKAARLRPAPMAGQRLQLDDE